MIKMAEIWAFCKKYGGKPKCLKIIFEKSLDFFKLSTHSIRAFKLRQHKNKKLNP